MNEILFFGMTEREGEEGDKEKGRQRQIQTEQNGLVEQKRTEQRESTVEWIVFR